MRDTMSEIQLTTGGHQGKAQARRSRPAYGTDLHRVERLLEELEYMAQRLLRLHRDVERGEDGDAGTKFGTLKRKCCERLGVMSIQEIRPLLVEREAWQPGVLAAFDEDIFLTEPDPRQGAETFVRYIGKLRALLLRAAGNDAAARANIGTAEVSGKLVAAAVTQTARIGEENGAEYLSATQVAARYNVSPKTVQRKLRHHPAVEHINTTEKKGHRRSRDVLRIPAWLAEHIWNTGNR